MSPLDQNVSNVLLGGKWRKITNSFRKIEVAGSKQKAIPQMWMCVVVKVMFNAIKNNIGQEPGILEFMDQYRMDVVKQEMAK